MFNNSISLRDKGLFEDYTVFNAKVSNSLNGNSYQVCHERSIIKDCFNGATVGFFSSFGNKTKSSYKDILFNMGKGCLVNVLAESASCEFDRIKFERDIRKLEEELLDDNKVTTTVENSSNKSGKVVNINVVDKNGKERNYKRDADEYIKSLNKELKREANRQNYNGNVIEFNFSDLNSLDDMSVVDLNNAHNEFDSYNDSNGSRF